MMQYSYILSFVRIGKDIWLCSEIKHFLKICRKYRIFSFFFCQAAVSKFYKLFSHVGVWILPGIEESRRLTFLLKMYEFMKIFQVIWVSITISAMCQASSPYDWLYLCCSATQAEENNAITLSGLLTPKMAAERELKFDLWLIWLGLCLAGGRYRSVKDVRH